VVSNDIAVVRPLVDTAVAIGVSLPKYDAQLFNSQLAAGHLLNAVAMPIAADVALVPLALIEGAVFPIVAAAATTVTQLAELAGLQPNPTDPPAAAPAASTVSTDPAPSAATTMATTSSLIRQAIRAGVATTASVGAPAAASAATASEVQTKPVVNKFARLVTTTLNTVKAQTGAAAPILRTVAPKRTVVPKPLSFAVNGGPVVGKPKVSRSEPTAHSDSLRTAVKSTTSNLSNTVKHAIGTISKKAQKN